MWKRPASNGIFSPVLYSCFTPRIHVWNAWIIFSSTNNAITMEQLNDAILNIVHRDFAGAQTERVIRELSSIGLNHVMGGSDYNLENTRLSILALAKGDLNQVIYLTERAKIDFRDVILWATQDTSRDLPFSPPV
jgi:hypothetical protein